MVQHNCAEGLLRCKMPSFRLWSPVRRKKGMKNITRRANFVAQVKADSQIDFPPFRLVSKGSDYELRSYSPYVVVRMPYQRRDEGYIGLGAYFDGANKQELRLRQSQPIVMRFHANGDKTMELFVGSRLDGQHLDGVPQPNDRRLSIEVAGAELLAVLRFEGNATREATLNALQRLQAILIADGLWAPGTELAGTFMLAQYGPLNSLSTRVNEVMLCINF